MQRLRCSAYLAGAALTLAGCDNGPDQWDAFVYPDSGNLLVHEEIRGFKSFELCQEAAISHLRQHHAPEAGDYECGHRCRPVSEYGGLNVCKETRK